MDISQCPLLCGPTELHECRVPGTTRKVVAGRHTSRGVRRESGGAIEGHRDMDEWLGDRAIPRDLSVPKFSLVACTIFGGHPTRERSRDDELCAKQGKNKMLTLQRLVDPPPNPDPKPRVPQQIAPGKPKVYPLVTSYNTSEHNLENLKTLKDKDSHD